MAPDNPSSAATNATDSIRGAASPATHSLPAPPFIVGIGASAGGHEALKQFFTPLPSDTGFAFVVIMHLLADRPSLLADILKHHTAMKVSAIEEGMPLQPNTVFVAPPGRVLAVRESCFRLLPSEQQNRPDQPIDYFLSSVAETLGYRAIAVILSGFGADGSQGVRKVKSAGGMVFVQHPATATNPPMPQNAIDTGAVDEILPPEEIAARLAQIASGERFAENEIRLKAPSEDEWRSLFSVLKTRTSHDFSSYKKNTVLRRIERRMDVNAVEKFSQYLEMLEASPQEPYALCHELLIGVTSFFRDSEAFDRLRTEIIPRLFAGRNNGESVRIWHACCATGEEAYSVAMLVREYLDAEHLDAKVQIFATDLDESAVAQARAGVYSDDVTLQVGEERLHRFFTKCEDRWQVKKILREMIVFAPHNIIKDPPFSRLDLLVCRNFLIYLNPDVQRLLIPLFHQVLNPGGFLFLGSAETVGLHSNLFLPVDKKWKIFIRQGGKSKGEMLLPFASPVRKLGDMEEVSPQVEREEARIAFAEKLLMERYVPVRVIINEKNEVIHFSSRAGAYFTMPEGKPTRDLLKMAREELRPALRAASYKVFSTQREMTYRGITVSANGIDTLVNIIVLPLIEQGATSKLALVVIEPASASTADSTIAGDECPVTDSSRNALIRQLEEQLRVTSEQLQSTSEQLETSNERFMLTNEELMTVNEELQSTNEELQSTNEELVTVNSELQRKIEELNQSSSDLENLFASSGIAAIFLDRELFVKRFSPAMAEIFGLIPADMGRPFRHLSGTINWADLSGDAASVLATLAPVEREVDSLKDGRNFVMRVLPYKTTEGTVDGVVVTLVDITARKRAELALREGDERLRFALENSHVGAWELDLQGKKAYRSAEHGRIFGYAEPLSEWTLEMFMDHVVPEDRPRVQETIRHGMTARSGWEFECRIRRTDGEMRWIWVAGRQSLDVTAGIRRVTGIVQDITERKQAEEDLRASQAKLAAALSSMTDAVFISDAAGQFLEFNDAFATFHRFKNKHVCFKKLEDYPGIIEVFSATGEPAPLEMWAVRRALRGETATNAIYTLRRKDTGETWVGSYSFSPIRDDQGGIIGSVVVCRDVTELKMQEEALQESERMYRSLFENMLNGFAYCRMLFDEKGPSDFIYLNVNRAFEGLTGLTNVVGRKVSEVIPGIRSSDPGLFEIYGRVALTGVPERHEVYLAAMDMWFALSVYSPQKEYFVAIFDVITERKRFEEALQISEQRRSLALEAAQTGTWEWDLQTDENIWSKELWQLYGLEPFSCQPSYEEWRKIVHPDDRFKTEQILRAAIAKGREYTTEWRVNLGDGSERWLMSRGRPIKGSDGQVMRYLGIVMDVTDRKRSEEDRKSLQAQLIQAHKMEAIGTLAGGIAHDFNNILGAVIGYAEMAKEASAPESEIAKDLEKVLDAGDRAANLVKQILAFSRQANMERIALEPVHLVKEAIKLLRPALPSTINIRQHFAKATRTIFADPTQIHQIVMNLATNAFHAMELTGGVLEISLSDCELSEEEVSGRVNVQPGLFVVLTVRDTGPGIAPTIQDKIFEPYFTTKETGKGTGLGLSIIHGIVTTMGGFITCESQLGAGATFRVYFPAVEKEETAAVSTSAPIATGRERILFVDDEEILAEMGKIMLERLGYSVTIRTSSIEALATFQNQPERFDVIITDQTMPGITGLDLSRRILQIRPEIPIILCTGYSNLVDEDQAKAVGIKGFIMKPMLKKDIALMLRKVLEAGAAA